MIGIIIIVLLVSALTPEEYWKRIYAVIADISDFFNRICMNAKVFFRELYEVISFPLRDLVGCIGLFSNQLFSYHKTKKDEEAKVQEQVFDAWQKIKKGDDSGKKDLIVLIRQHGHSKIMTMLREVQMWDDDEL